MSNKEPIQVVTEERSYLRQTADILSDALIVIDHTDQILSVNAAAEKLIGAPASHLLGNTLWPCAPHLISALLYQTVVRVRQAGEPDEVEYLSLVTNTPLRVSIAPTVEGISLTFRQATAQSHIQERTRENNHICHAIPDSLRAFMAVLSPDGLLLEINRYPLEETGIQLEDVLGKPLVDTYWWSHSPTIRQQLREEIEQARQGQTVRFDSRAHNRTGHCVDVDITIAPHFSADQHVEYLLYSAIDVTKRKQMESEIRLLVDAIPQLVWVGRPDGYIEYHNQRWCDYTGMSLEESLGLGWLRCIHPDDRQQILDAWQVTLQTGQMPQDMEARHLNGKTGEYRWFLIRSDAIRDEYGKPLKWFGTCTDIHYQKLTEAALRISEVRFRSLFDSNIIGIALNDDKGHILDANDEYLRITGHTRADLLTGGLRWDTITPIEFQNLDQEAIRILQRTGTLLPWEKEYVRKDGSRVPVIIGAALLDSNSDQHIGFFLDITKRKELEKRKDEFISMVSHELKTPLTVLKMLVQRFRRKLIREQSTQEGGEQRELTLMEGQINSLTRLIDDLLDVSKIQMGKFDYIDEPLDIDTVIRETVDMLQQTTATHTLQLYGSSQKQMYGDKNRLEQVVANLISNATKYSPHADHVDITISDSDEAVTLSVRDYGIGICVADQGMIFDLFNRGACGIKVKTFPGLGAGLYITNEIVKHYNGTITVLSEQDRGSTFSVCLPT